MVQHPSKDGKLSWQPAPGDVATYRRVDGGPWGGHVTYVDSVAEDGTLSTMEGNASGDGPKGRILDGVVRGKHAAINAQMIVRMSMADFVGGVEYVP
jgi:hypothetical protein